jgi:hypothetical protein
MRDKYSIYGVAIMVWPGQVLKEIKKAIVSAFPNRDKLLPMLRYELDIQESEVPTGSNYGDIVDNLIRELETKERILELIEGALNHQPNNPNLQKLPYTIANLINQAIKRNSAEPNLKEIARDINAIALKNILNILISLEKNYFDEIKKAYFACCPKDLLDWKPETIKEIIDNLKDIQEETIDIPLVRFVAYLLRNNFPEKIVDDLLKWGKINSNHFPELLNKINNSQVQNPEKPIPSYLLVKIEPSLQNPKRYLISGWFTPDERTDFKQQLEVINQAVNLKDASGLLEDIINQMNIFINKSRLCMELPVIMFFLPNDLFNEPVDCWLYDSQTIGSTYSVVIRSCDRLKQEYGFKSVWFEKWEKLNNSAYNTFISGDCQMLTAELHKNVGFKWTQPISREIIKKLNRTAIPVAIWLRKVPNKVPNINCDAELNALLNCTITDLLQKVVTKRAEAVDIPDKDQHIGHHLALLWENPYILPPTIEYTTP